MADFVSLLYKKVKKGESYQQITLALAKAGASQEEIEQAFRTYAFRQKLSTYMLSQKNLGHPVKETRKVLFSQGYRPEDLDFAESMLSGFVLDSKIIMIAIVAVAVCGLAFYLFSPDETERPKKLLDYQLTPEKKVLGPGDDLEFDVKLINFGYSGRFDVVLEHSIKDESGKTLDFVTETVAVETQTTKPVKIELEIGKGSYLLSSVARYQGQRADAGFSFSIGSGAEPLKNETIIDDEPVVKPRDGTTTVDVIAEMNKGLEGPNKEAVCDAQKEAVYADYCYGKLASLMNDGSYCDYIGSTENRDFCLADISVRTGDAALCDKVSSPSMRAICVA
jgi:hypothetical protein